MKTSWKISLGTLLLIALGGAVFAVSGCTLFGCKSRLETFTIRTFQECVDAGYPLIGGDPPKCLLNKETILSKEPEHIRVKSPEPFTRISSPLEVVGMARAKNNKIYYRLQTNSQVVLGEGMINAHSDGHGRWGDFHFEIDFELPEIPSGKLFLFEEGQQWNDEAVLIIPLNFEFQADFFSAQPIEGADDMDEVSEVFDPLDRLQQLDPPGSIELKLPFTPQAPFADWNPPFDEACEEASLIMVEYFLRDAPLSRTKAESEIILQVDWQSEHGYEVDMDTADLAEVARQYYHRQAKRYVGEEVTLLNIQRLLAGGYPVIVPVAGQRLGNPNFRGAGPPYHMLVIIGYDEEHFITHDPGTRNGANYVYRFETIMNAIHDWIGSKETIEQGPKAVLVIGKESP